MPLVKQLKLQRFFNVAIQKTQQYQLSPNGLSHQDNRALIKLLTDLCIHCASYFKDHHEREAHEIVRPLVTHLLDQFIALKFAPLEYANRIAGQLLKDLLALTIELPADNPPLQDVAPAPSEATTVFEHQLQAIASTAAPLKLYSCHRCFSSYSIYSERVRQALIDLFSDPAKREIFIHYNFEEWPAKFKCLMENEAELFTLLQFMVTASNRTVDDFSVLASDINNLIMLELWDLAYFNILKDTPHRSEITTIIKLLSVNKIDNITVLLNEILLLDQDRLRLLNGILIEMDKFADLITFSRIHKIIELFKTNEYAREFLHPIVHELTLHQHLNIVSIDYLLEAVSLETSESSSSDYELVIARAGTLGVVATCTWLDTQLAHSIHSYCLATAPVYTGRYNTGEIFDIHEIYKMFQILSTSHLLTKENLQLFTHDEDPHQLAADKVIPFVTTVIEIQGASKISAAEFTCIMSRKTTDTTGESSTSKDQPVTATDVPTAAPVTTSTSMTTSEPVLNASWYKGLAQNLPAMTELCWFVPEDESLYERLHNKLENQNNLSYYAVLCTLHHLRRLLYQQTALTEECINLSTRAQRLAAQRFIEQYYLDYTVHIDSISPSQFNVIIAICFVYQNYLKCKISIEKISEAFYLIQRSLNLLYSGSDDGNKEDKPAPHDKFIAVYLLLRCYQGKALSDFYRHNARTQSFAKWLDIAATLKVKAAEFALAYLMAKVDSSATNFKVLLELGEQCHGKNLASLYQFLFPELLAHLQRVYLAEGPLQFSSYLSMRCHLEAILGSSQLADQQIETLRDATANSDAFNNWCLQKLIRRSAPAALSFSLTPKTATTEASATSQVNSDDKEDFGVRVVFSYSSIT